MLSIVQQALTRVLGVPLEDLLLRMGDTSPLAVRRLRADNEVVRLVPLPRLEHRLAVDLPDGADPVAFVAEILLREALRQMAEIAAAEDDEPEPVAPLADLFAYAVALAALARWTNGPGDGEVVRAGEGHRAERGPLGRFRADGLLTRLLCERRRDIHRSATMALLDREAARLRVRVPEPPVEERCRETRAALRQGIVRALSHEDHERRSFYADVNRAIREGVRSGGDDGSSGAEPSYVGIAGASFPLPVTVHRVGGRSWATDPWILEVVDGEGRERRIGATERLAFGGEDGPVRVEHGSVTMNVEAGEWYEMPTSVLGEVRVSGGATRVRIARRSMLRRATVRVGGREVQVLTTRGGAPGRPAPFEVVVRCSAGLHLGGVQLRPGARVARGKDAFVLFVEALVARVPEGCVRLQDARAVCWMRSIWWTPGAGVAGAIRLAEADEADEEGAGARVDDSPHHGRTVELDVLERVRDRVAAALAAGEPPSDVVVRLSVDPEVVAFVEHLRGVGRDGVVTSPRVVVRRVVEALRERSPTGEERGGEGPASASARRPGRASARSCDPPR